MQNIIFFTHKKKDFELYFDKSALKYLDKKIKILSNPLNRRLNEDELIKYQNEYAGGYTQDFLTTVDPEDGQTYNILNYAAYLQETKKSRFHMMLKN